MENGMFNEDFSLDNILYEAKIGLWYIEIDEGMPPRMYADCAMLELLGLEENPTPEDCYVHWHDRIGPAYLEMVDEIVKIMAAGQHGEVSYAWNHPKWGKIYIRCGGNCDNSYVNGIRLKGYHQNITELISLKREAEQLKSFHEIMLSSLKELYFFIMLLDVDRDIIYPLHMPEEGMGYVKEKSSMAQVLENMTVFYHPEDQERMLGEISIDNLNYHLAEGKKKFIREYRRKIRGEYHWVTLTCYFMQQSGNNRKVLIAIQDIDEQKRQEKEYQEYLKNRYKGSMEILRMSLKNTNILEYYYYPKEDRLVFPQMTAEYYQCAREYIGVDRKTAGDLVDRNYRDLFCRVHEYIKNGGKSDYFFYSCGHGKRWCKCSISSVNFDEDGHTVFAVGIIEELTTQRNMQWQNEQYQSIYRHTVELEYDGIGIIDLKTGEVDVKIAEHINTNQRSLKENLSYVKKRFIENFMCEEDQAYFREEFDVLNVLSRLDEEEVLHFSFLSKEKDGKRHKDFAIRYFNEEKTKLFVCVRDIEQQIRLEQESKEALRKAFEAAERANEAKSEFISKMSHDIRTPMNAIVGMTAIAKANIDDKERVLDCLNKIKIANEHLLNLINEVLDMSRIESGKMNLSEGTFDIKELLEGVTTILQPRAQQKQQALTLDFVDMKHTAVLGDHVSLQKIFNNILGNAIKYTQEQGKIQVTAIELPSPHQDYGYYRFIFEDNGYGMSEEFIQRLFVPFERSRDPRVENIEGTGLGMPIVYNLIQLMQGEIQVESELNKGSTFTVNLFFLLQEGKNDNSGEGEAVKKELSFVGKRVLLVEDNELNIEIAMEILKGYGLEICTACNGMEAVKQYQEQEPGYFDLIFMDIQMPVMDGYTAAKEIRGGGREDSFQIPIVAMTANAFSEDVQKTIHTGMNDHVAKPIDIEVLEKVLAKWLGE